MSWTDKLREIRKPLDGKNDWYVDWSEDAVRAMAGPFIHIGRDAEHCTHPAAPFLALARNIWPEIVAVIEAADEVTYDRSELVEALAALKAKVEG